MADLSLRPMRRPTRSTRGWSFDAAVAFMLNNHVAMINDNIGSFPPEALPQLQKLAPGFDWRSYLTGRGLDVNELIVAEPSAFTGIAALSAKAPLQVLRDQMIVQSLERTQGNKGAAARLLGLKRTTLVEKLKRMNYSMSS